MVVSVGRSLSACSTYIRNVGVKPRCVGISSTTINSSKLCQYYSDVSWQYMYLNINVSTLTTVGFMYYSWSGSHSTFFAI